MAALVEWKPASAVLEDAEVDKVAAAEAAKPKEKLLSNLASHIEKRWETAKTSKRTTEEQFMENLRARRREYTPSMLAALKQMFGPEYEPVYAPVIETKCSAAESWIKEIFFQKGERPWDLQPTPLPELPPSIMTIVEMMVRQQVMMEEMQEQMAGAPPDEMYAEQRIQQVLPEAADKVAKVIEDLARNSAMKVAKKIEDMFIEGNWNPTLNDCIYDIVTFGTMIMKGPYIERTPTPVTDFNPMTGKWERTIENRLKEYWCRVNPFDMYPLPGTTNPQNGDFLEVIRMTPKQLSDLMDVKGWDKKAIKEVLRVYRDNGLVEWKTTDQERQLLEGKESSDLNESRNIDCLEYHGSAPGSILIEWGMSSAEVPEPEREYDIVAWKINRWVIKAIINPNPLGQRPYYTAGFREIPDSFWHIGVPQLAEGAQKLANAVFRSIAINVALASGPQIEVDVERLAPGEQFKMWPYRVWKSTNQQLREGQAVNFFQPQIVTGPLMDVFELCLRMADEDTGVPRYAHGDPKTSGAGETSSGLAMLMSQSAKGIKMVVKNIDEGVVSKSVEYAYNHLMQYDETISPIGDLRAVATGSYALMAREQQAIRRTEFLVQTANPFDMQVLGVKGRAELIKQALKSLDIDPEKVMKEMDDLEEMSQTMTPQNMPKNDVGMSAGPLPTPLGLSPGAPPPAPMATDSAGLPVAGRDNQLFQSAPGVTP